MLLHGVGIRLNALPVTRGMGRLATPVPAPGRSPGLKIDTQRGLPIGAFQLPYSGIIPLRSLHTVTSSYRILTCFPFHRARPRLKGRRGARHLGPILFTLNSSIPAWFCQVGGLCCRRLRGVPPAVQSWLRQLLGSAPKNPATFEKVDETFVLLSVSCFWSFGEIHLSVIIII